MNLFIAIVVGIVVLAVAGALYAIAIRRLPGKQPGEEQLEALLDRVRDLGFRVERGDGSLRITQEAPPPAANPQEVVASSAAPPASGEAQASSTPGVN